jgi:uncharacterized glyoxalase superfamily protein PhnB
VDGFRLKRGSRMKDDLAVQKDSRGRESFRASESSLTGRRVAAAFLGEFCMSEQAQPTRVVPNISLAGRSREAIALWTRAFGAKEIAAYAEGDRIRHGEVEINGGAVFVTDFNMDPQHVFQPTPSIAMHLAVPDGMTWMSRAEAAGCKILTPWRKMPFGGFGRVTDPFGIIWQIATPNDLPG